MGEVMPGIPGQHMSDAALPAIFIPSGVYGEPMLGTPDMWDSPEGRYVRAEDFLALKAAWGREKLAAQVYCPTCGNYMPGHATGAMDICVCAAAWHDVEDSNPLDHYGQS